MGCPSADDHVVSIAQWRDQPRNIRWVVLAVGVHEYERGTASVARPGFYRGAVSHSIRMGDDLNLILQAHGHRVIARSIVYHQDLRIGQLVPDPGKQCIEMLSFIAAW